MKRLGYAAIVAVFVGALVFGLSRDGGAQSDEIPVLQTQVAELDARVSTLEEHVAASPVGGVSAVGTQGSASAFTGTGDQVVNLGMLESGAYTIHGTFAEAGEVSIRVVPIGPGTTKSINWQLSGPGELWQVIVIQPGYDDVHIMEVHVTGDWLITIEPVP